MANCFGKLGVVLVCTPLAAAAPVHAVPTYAEAKSVYQELGEAANGMEKAEKDCVKAGTSAASGVLAWKKSRDLGINKDQWWKKAKLSGLEKAEIELLYKTSYARFQKAILAGGKQCYNDERFQKALAEFKGKDGG
jgi:hypothetical protein